MQVSPMPFEYTGDVQEPKSYKHASHRIVCAAVMYPANVIVACPRHGDKIFQDFVNGNAVYAKMSYIEGFLDNDGKFLRPKEAWKIAKAAGQIIRRVSGDRQGTYGEGYLKSENLY